MSLDAVVDIVKLFDTLSLLGNFSVYVFPKQLSSIIFKRRRKLKKSYFLQPPLIDYTKIRKIKNEGKTPSDFNSLLSIFKETRKTFYKWLSLLQG